MIYTFLTLIDVNIIGESLLYLCMIYNLKYSLGSQTHLLNKDLNIPDGNSEIVDADKYIETDRIIKKDKYLNMPYGLYFSFIPI